MYISKIKSKCGIAQLSLPFLSYFTAAAYVHLVELINLNDLLDDATFLLSTLFTRPKKCRFNLYGISLTQKTCQRPPISCAAMWSDGERLEPMTDPDTLCVQLWSKHSVLNSSPNTDPDTLCSQLLCRQFVYSTLIQTLSMHNIDPDSLCVQIWPRHSLCWTPIQTLSSDQDTLCAHLWSRHFVFSTQIQTLSRCSVFSTLMRAICSTLIQTLYVFCSDPDTLCAQLLFKYSVCSTII